MLVVHPSPGQLSSAAYGRMRTEMSFLGTSGGGFTPLAPPPGAAPIRWYSSRNVLNGSNPADGGSVTSWDDLSSNGDVLQPHFSSPAVYAKSSLNGLPSVNLAASVQYESTNNVALTGNAPFTVLFQVKFPSIPVTDVSDIVFSLGDSADVNTGLRIKMELGNLSLQDGVNDVYGSPVAMGTGWNIFALTYDGGTLRLWKGGQLVIVAAAALALNSAPLFIGDTGVQAMEFFDIVLYDFAYDVDGVNRSGQWYAGTIHTQAVLNCSMTIAQNVVGCPSTAGMQVGDALTGPGISPPATIQTVNPTSFGFIGASATVTASGVTLFLNAGAPATGLAWTPYVADLAYIAGYVGGVDASLLAAGAKATAGSFTQSDVSKQPIAVLNSQNGLTGLVFDAIDDGMISSISLTNPFSIVLVETGGSSASRRTIQAGVSNCLMSYFRIVANQIYNNGDVYNGGVNPLGAGYGQLVVGLESRFYFKGVDITTGTGSISNWGSVALGAAGSQNELCASTLLENGCYNREISSADRAWIDAYLAAKWGF